MQVQAIDQVVDRRVKRCPSCPRHGRPAEQPVDAFNKNARRAGGLDGICRACRHDERGPRVRVPKARGVHVRRDSLYTRLLNAQHWRCAACKRPESIHRNGKPIHLSYHRLEGYARTIEALVCSGCLIAIHAVQSDAQRALQIGSYLLEADRVDGALRTAILERTGDDSCPDPCD